jgi:uncharacterized protein YsxB (DUF464 family)
MVSIRFCRDIGKLWFEGHAEYADKGTDIVCAAVSALYETLALHETTYPGELKPGHRFIWAAPGKFTEAMPIMEAFAAGFRQIAKQYPDHVSYEEM